MDFEYSQAGREDEPEIRLLLASSPMPGRLTIAFEREPDYFLGCPIMGPDYQVVLARNRGNKELAGIVYRGVSPRFVNGSVERVGYISQVRVAPKYQGYMLPLRLLPRVRELDKDGNRYYAVIAEQNATARDIFVDHARRSFPRAEEVGRLVTLAIVLRRPRRQGSCPVVRGSKQRLGSIVEMLNRAGAKKQLFPQYSAEDFVDSPRTLGFDIEDFVVFWSGDKVLGVMGLWDQSAFKQSRVRSYSGSLRALGPLYSAVLRLIGGKPLPRVGEHLHSAYAAFIVVDGNNPDIFKSLLRALYNLAVKREYAYLMLLLGENDPLLDVAVRYPHIRYNSLLYTFSFRERLKGLDGRIPYVEIAAL